MDTKISVVMPVYNSRRYLSEAVNSILNQTFSDFEFLIIDDCSTDNSWEILKSYTDRRIRLFRNDKNLGASMTRNMGLEMSKGIYIALMDADDLSLRTRFAHQVALMDKKPDIGICGTWARAFGAEKRIMRNPVDSDDILIGLLFNNCFINTSVFLRNAFFKEHKLSFKPFIEPSEDYELWVRCARFFKLANIPKVLVSYRVHEEQISKTKQAKQNEVTKWVRKAQVNELGLYPNEEELEIFNRFSWQKYDDDRKYLSVIEAWFFKLMNANKKVKKYPDLKFKNYLATKFFITHYYLKKYGIFIDNLWNQRIIVDTNLISWKQRLQFRLRGVSGFFSHLYEVLLFSIFAK